MPSPEAVRSSSYGAPVSIKAAPKRSDGGDRLKVRQLPPGRTRQKISTHH
jgi:hypothetical protein